MITLKGLYKGTRFCSSPLPNLRFNELKPTTSNSINYSSASPQTTMSLSRQFRPLFRLLDEPFGRPYPSTNAVSRNSPSFGSFFNDPFFNRSEFEMNLPAVDLTEHANEFVVEAELPGVKKENVEIRIGDGGQSLTIEGKSFVRSSSGRQAEAPAAAESQPPIVGDSTPSDTADGSPSGAGAGSQAVTETNKGEVGTPIFFGALLLLVFVLLSHHLASSSCRWC